MFPCSQNVKFNLLVGDRLFFFICKFEMAIFQIVQVMAENIRFAFLYVLSIFLIDYVRHIETKHERTSDGGNGSHNV